MMMNGAMINATRLCVRINAAKVRVKMRREDRLEMRVICMTDQKTQGIIASPHVSGYAPRWRVFI